MTRKRRKFLGSLQSRFIVVYLIVMAPIALFASVYQFSILTDRYHTREIAALDALGNGSASVTSTLVQTNLLLDILSELSTQDLSEGEECDMVISAILKAQFPVVAAGIYSPEGQPICTQGIVRSGMVADTTATTIRPDVTLSERDLFVTQTVQTRIIAIEAELSPIEPPEIATDHAFLSPTTMAADADHPTYHQLANLPAPTARGIVSGPAGEDIAVLPVAAFDLRFFATLTSGIAAPPLWLTIVNASFVPLALLAISLMLADLLIRKMALDDINQLTDEMRAFRRDRDLPRSEPGPWDSSETEAMRSEFSTLSEQLLHEEAEAQNRLHNANILQREIFHRVGNNLQIIQSILRLYANDVDTSAERKLVERLALRIRVINLVHNAMHRSTDAPTLPVGSAVRQLVQGLRHEGLVADNIKIRENYRDVQLRVSRVYALCYLIVEKMDRLSRSGATHVEIDLVEEGDQAHLTIRTDVQTLAAPDTVSERLRQVYLHDLRATARWIDGDAGIVYDAVMPRQID
ncbi:histidine kinase dimerization/phosphoacceptor domain -containing protein [uncultured Aliiroseovarius sp.]|uniref:histidine kinase dimerization/phosphoacceptor domain -containing protein n=1 Tax=uncultured Aliiroseovarius sp. TaxID=1658783 RepID=UPI002594FECC|nr:histidine kinase dimerization/phosphoacceptor domain -containing protein [uncultured Aliiroseovarius sp.]